MDSYSAIVDSYVEQRTGGKTAGSIGYGYYRISHAQAQKLCGGTVPRPGYIRSFQLDGQPSFTSGTRAYEIQRTQHWGAEVWAITIREAAFGLEWRATGPWRERFVGDWVQDGTWTLSGAAFPA